VKLTTHLPLVLRFGMNGAVSPLPHALSYITYVDTFAKECNGTGHKLSTEKNIILRGNRIYVHQNNGPHS